MSRVSWGSFEAEDNIQHTLVLEQLTAAMETGHHAVARELLDEYAKEFPAKSEALRLSLVRRFGTGL